jgi:hypothetical protein
MSRRAMVVVVALFLGALLVANIVVLAIWLPSRKASRTNPEPQKLTAAAVASQSTPARSTGGATPVTKSAGDFAVERQVASASGNLRIEYLRNRASKMRRIVVEDAKRPDSSAILCESKHTVWALVSPNDQWIVINERGGTTDQRGVSLYHRRGDSLVQYALVQEARPDAGTLQDAVWKAYLNATNADPNTPRQGVTIDATAWENDSQKVDFSVAYLPGPNDPDVPAPWSCTYDVASKQVAPVSVPKADEANDESAVSEEQGSEEASNNNPVADNAPESGPETGDENELPGERFPATRLDELTVEDVNESSLSDITYAINEMYARHGAEFKDAKVAAQFKEFSWYKLRPGLSLADAESEFDDLEKHNMEVLRRCRDAKLAASRHKSHSERRQDEESTGAKILRGIQTWQDMGGPIPPHP